MGIEDFKIIYEFKNPYFKRDEYLIEFDLNKSKLPSRQEMQELISKRLNRPKEMIIIRKISSQYGGFKGYADVRIYEDKESMKIEPEHIILRHMGREERKKIIEERKKKKLEEKKSKEVTKK